MLPELTTPPADTQAGPGRYIQRAREVALQKIIESTAIARVNRASRTTTTAPGEVLNYQPNDLVDYVRQPGQKDVSGWHGPAKVIQNRPEAGQVDVLPLGPGHHMKILVRYGDVRRFIDFTGLVYASGPNSTLRNVANLIDQHISRMSPTRFDTIEYARRPGGD